MRKYIKNLLFLIAFFTLSLSNFAQQSAPTVEMADAMRSNGKIFVVVAVILTLFSGIVLYLVSLDRKISRLEKEAGKL